MTGPSFDAGPLENYLGFTLDGLAGKLLIGASPPGTVPPDEMERLHQVVHPLADRLGYARSLTFS